MKAWIDIDSTLTDPKSHCARIQANTFKGVIQPMAWDRGAVLDDLPAPGAWEGVFRLRRLGYEIHYLTARYYGNAEEITKEWLVQHSFCPSSGSIHVVKSAAEKIPFLREHSQAGDLFIDDMSYGQEHGDSYIHLYDELIKEIKTLPLTFILFKGNWSDVRNVES